MAQTLTISFGGSVAAAPSPVAPPPSPTPTPTPKPPPGDGMMAALLPPWLERLRTGIIAAISGSIDFLSRQVAGSISALIREPSGAAAPSAMLGATANLFGRLKKYYTPDKDEEEEKEKEKKKAAAPAAAVAAPAPPPSMRPGAGPTLMGQPVYTGAPVGAGPTMMSMPTYGPSTYPQPPTPPTAPPAAPQGPTLMGQKTYAPPPTPPPAPAAGGAAGGGAGGGAAEGGGFSAAATGTLGVVNAVMNSAKAMYDGITALVQSTNARASQLATFSAPVTYAMTQSEVREMLADMDEAGKLGPKMAELIDQQTELSMEWREFWLPFKEIIIDALTTLVRWGRSIVAAMKQLVWWMSRLSDWVFRRKEEEDPIVDEAKRHGALMENPVMKSMLDFMRADPFTTPDPGRPLVGPPAPPGWQAPAPRADQTQGGMPPGGRPPMLDF